MFKDQLNKNLHKVVRTDPFINEINGSVGMSLDNINGQINMFVNQLDISKATWSLPVYEKELGIETNISKTLDERRSQIISRLRGTGKTGAEEIKLVADSYTNGDVDVYLDQGIVIEFNSLYGIPSNIDDLRKVIRNIAPAHLKVNFKFKFSIYKDYKEKVYSGLNTYTYKQLMNGGK